MTYLFTQFYPVPIVQAAQICGARLLKEPFFPRWMVNQYSDKKLIVVRPTNRSHYYTVSVYNENKTNCQSETVYAVLEKK